MNTVQSGLKALRDGSIQQPNLVMAGTIIAAVPIVIALLLFQSRSSAASRRGRSRDEARRDPAWPARRPPLVIAPACGSGESIIVAGNDTPTDDPAGRRPAAAERDRPRRRRSRRRASTPAAARPTTTTRRRTRPRRPRRCDAADLPGRRPRRGLEPVEITFWHGLTVDNEDRHQRITDDYNASQNGVHVELREPGRLPRDDRQVLPVEPSTTGRRS